MQITRSEQQEDQTYKRWQVIIFENDFQDFISAFASLFQNVAYQGRDFQTVVDIKDEQQTKGIRALPEAQRPREKLISKGAAALSNKELLALLIGSGTPNESAIDLGERILDRTGEKVTGLKLVTMSQLCSIRGMGVARSCSVLAAVELARRLYDCPRPEFKTVYITRYPGDDPDDYLRRWKARN